MSAQINYRLDIFNNTGLTLTVTPWSNQNMALATFTQASLAPQKWLSADNNNQPYPLQINSNNETGNFTINVQVASGGAEGSLRLEFDTNPLQNFPNVAMFSSAGDFNPLSTGAGWLFPTLYLSVYQGLTLAVVVLLNAEGASNQIAYPQYG